ncbi:FKBP-type peptidyl-prolyl cis-trans isomerase [Halobellus limi]|uniref:Peptidyl-prolyl cis-trans isomerase n=1 Tax=Halobellus limi TaxID=699433 RepID=A0A1H5VG18_9EURY|nr:peptidylprolyl isomerase [Halobellus limi]QCC46719.1 peptidylprolyl isomerase [Halobellus limi]SEF86292.1 peptidyl-prolyl cis-trans isomerase B (cyclophilin B) [Halobellus limi]
MTVERGDRVAVEYVGRFEDGTVFGTSKHAVAAEHGLDEAQDRDADDYGPLAFRVGDGDVIDGLDEAVRGMAVGEERTVRVPPEAAYGEVQSDRIREYDRETFEGMVGEEPEVGLHVHARNGLHGDVVAVREGAVEVDFNHELAGRTLVFEIEVVDRRPDRSE